MPRGTLSSAFHRASSISDVNFFPEANVAVKDTPSMVQFTVCSAIFIIIIIGLIPHPVRFLDEPDIILKSKKR
ncbi:hypothetical protein AFLA_012487 [Aspergillus flavus NRRL3357]|nr:hypothetical protein AFLA_012487 [Aspergillus flavus NRRL3357]